MALVTRPNAATSLLAYGLMTQQVLAPAYLLCLSLNIVACSCPGYYTFRTKAYANALPNSLWLLVSLAGLRRLL